MCSLRGKWHTEERSDSVSILRGERLGISLEGLMRRVWPIGAIIIGARMLVGNFIFTTASRQSFFFDNLSTPFALILVIGGAYFLLKDYD